MITQTSGFVDHDRVLIVDGPLHGFEGTVLKAEPGKLFVSLDGFGSGNCVKVSDNSVELRSRAVGSYAWPGDLAARE